jgi:caa(3)-type oxidase subunit IV
VTTWKMLPSGRTDRTWLILMGLTILTTWVLSKELVDARLATVATLVVAGLKVRWVFLDFMELRDAPRIGRAVFELWSVAVPAMMIGFYLTA